MASELASDMMLPTYLIGGGGGTQNYKVVKNKKGKSFIFLVVSSLPQTHDDQIGDWSSLREDQSPCRSQMSAMTALWS